MRHPWADRVRVTVIAGVMIVHVAATYLVGTGWYYQELTGSAVTPLIAAIPLGVGAVYGLAPLFLISGWLARVSVSRHGTAAFARSRLVRLGVPLLVYLVVVDPLSRWLAGRPIAGAHDLGEMWFVVALLVFSLLYAAFPLPRLESSARLVVGITAAVAVADFAVWLRWSYTDDTPWNLNWTHWPQAAGVFALGALVRVEDVPPAFSRKCGWTALAGLVSLMVLWGAAIVTGRLDDLAGGWHRGTVVFAVLDGLTAITLSLWIACRCRLRWNQPLGAVGARAARGSYAAYVLHPLLLVSASLAARPLPWPPEVKFLLVAGLGVPASFLIGYVVTLFPGVRRVM